MVGMGDHHRNPNSLHLAEVAARRLPAHQPGDRLLTAQLGWDYAPKPNVLALPAAAIRRDEAGKVVEIYVQRRGPTGEPLEPEPRWQAPAEGIHVHEDGKPLAQEHTDIVFMPVSIMVNPKMVNGVTGQPLRQSVLPLNAVIARVDAKSLMAAHEKQLMGDLSEMPR